jgi:hypothetical protein
MKIHFMTLALGLVGVSSVAFGGWTHNVEIKTLYAQESGNYLVNTTEPTKENPDSCSNTNFYRIETTNANRSEIIALLLAAKAKGETVNLSIGGGCVNDSPKIRHAAWGELSE